MFWILIYSLVASCALPKPPDNPDREILLGGKSFKNSGVDYADVYIGGYAKTYPFIGLGIGRKISKEIQVTDSSFFQVENPYNSDTKFRMDSIYLQANMRLILSKVYVNFGRMYIEGTDFDNKDNTFVEKTNYLGMGGVFYIPKTHFFLGGEAKYLMDMRGGCSGSQVENCKNAAFSNDKENLFDLAATFGIYIFR